MPQRPRAHELETLARNDFARRVPAAWVVRAADAESDYGIDRQVEIFTDNRATGLEFYAQLKATDTAFPGALTVPVTLETRDHYNALALPVLMFRFHGPTERAFAKWFHTYDPHYAARPPAEDAKTFTFRWDEADEWTAETPQRLTAEVAAFRRFREARLDAPVAFHVEAEQDTVSPAEALLVLRERAEHAQRVMALTAEPAAAGDATLRFERDRIVASLAGVASVSLHRAVGPEVSREIAGDALLTAGLAFLQIGRADAAAAVIAAVGATPSLLEMDVAGGAYVAFVASGRIEEALRLAREIGAMDTPEAEVAELTLAMAAVGPNVPEPAREEFRSVVRARAERRRARGATEDAGADYYNIGNSYRASRQPVQALRAYIAAARLAPDYRGRAYWNAEVGGMLFITEHFELSAAFYAQAVAIDPTPWSQGVHADALMYAGRYREAEDAFVSVANDTPEWALKAEMLPRIREAAGVDAQTRRRADAWAATTAAITGADRPMSEIQEGLRQAIRLDALNEDAWYWLALGSFEESPEEAADMMLVAALARRHDGSAWAFAFAFEWATRRQEERLLRIGATGFHLATSDFREQILAWARSDTQSGEREAIMAILAQAATMRDASEGFTLRLPSPDGVEEIGIEFPRPQ